jgi:hypothetical protein
MKTMAMLVLSPDVLTAALQDPTVRATDIVRRAANPEDVLRDTGTVRAEADAESSIILVTPCGLHPLHGW